ncbi:MAG: phospholipid carrier-dependent glycosyltransferase, partial [Anaerolineae bacterium]|nr:phospholipid carrier-dependent glycosyltransferase [Anaerolineae bacterium]
MSAHVTTKKPVQSMRTGYALHQWLEKHAYIVAAGLLLLFFWRIWSATNQQSITLDENIHIFSGVLYWQEKQLSSVVQNPPLINALIGLPVQLVFSPQLPIDFPVWQNKNWWKISRVFLWDANDNGLAMIAVGRLMISWLALLFGALIYRWSAQLFHTRLSGLFALFLFTFDPNILTHSSLATTDLGIAFFLTLAAYMIWRYWDVKKGSIPKYFLVGVCVGLAFSAKFTGVLLIPALLIIAIYRGVTSQFKWKTWGRMTLEIMGWLLIGISLFMLVYRFQLETLLADYAWQRTHQLEGHAAFLLGELRTTGWWYYFPLIFVIKTPLVTQVLLLFSLVLLLIKRQFRWQLLWPLLLAGGIFSAGLTSRVNIGYRYLLPMLPFLFVVMGQLAVTGYLKNKAGQLFVIASILILTLVSFNAHPHYLAYFNSLAGGSDNGWRIAVDSNIGWGQDIQRLGEYMVEQELETINVAAFGLSSLNDYGIQGKDLNFPVKSEKLADEFYPNWPAPGVYAISVTELFGIYSLEPERYHWFLERTPDEKVGYSLFVYDVVAEGAPVSVALAQLELKEIELEAFKSIFASNDVHVRNFDHRTSLLWPVGQPENEVWTAVPTDIEPYHATLADYYALASETVTVTIDQKDAPYQFSRWSPEILAQILQANENGRFRTDFGWSEFSSVSSLDWTEKRHPVTAPVVFDDTMQLLAYEPLWQETPESGQPLSLMT